MVEVLVGTSGWAYREWVGPFYPPGTPTRSMLASYSRLLTTVEAHATFRRHPTATVLQTWLAAVPPGFRFAPKAHLGITHRRDLDGLEVRVGTFLSALRPLGQALGPVLFQLPHRTVDLERLDRLLSAVPSGVAAAVELTPPWLKVDSVVERVAAHGNATLVVVDSDGGSPPIIDVGPFAYIRLRRARYSDLDLQHWATRIAAIVARSRAVSVFLRHDDEGRAPRAALALARLLRSEAR